ncbi:MAG: phosphodiester glycosidase family protein [Abditibacteriota bacterium]|nr:phosphodiester glycosidase family protein [Abditibacteriota bacterium]
MKRFLILILISFLAAGCGVEVVTDDSEPEPVRETSGPVYYAEFDMKDYKVVPYLAPEDTESFYDVVEKLDPEAAITGTYYDENYRPCGDIVYNGERVAKGHRTCGVAVDYEGNITFPHTSRKEDRPRQAFAVFCGPKLITEGKKDIDARRYGFSSRAESVEACRCAIGAKGSRVLVLCAVRKGVTLSELADILLERGVTDAVNMDGGSMCAYYCDGEFYDAPVGGVNNIAAVVKR